MTPAPATAPPRPRVVVLPWGKFWRGFYEDAAGRRHPIRPQRTEAAAHLAVEDVRRRVEGNRR